ncbi:MAG: hypothetical protein ACI4GW_11945 [Lachnospiraceae bacterium]
MLISIKDFANEKKVSVQAVYQQIKRHPELRIHIRKRKQIMYLDSYAQYVLTGHEIPKTISIDQSLSNFELLQKIDQLNLKIQQLEKENKSLQDLIQYYNNLIDQFYQKKEKIKMPVSPVNTRAGEFCPPGGQQ